MPVKSSKPSVQEDPQVPAMGPIGTNPVGEGDTEPFLPPNEEEVVAEQPMQRNPQQVKVKSEESIDPIIAAYNQRYMDENGGYPEGFGSPQPNEDGGVTFSFPSPKECTEFFKDQAEANPDQPFILMKGDDVLGYAYKGKLYHANHQEVEEGDSLGKHTVPKNDFDNNAIYDKSPTPG